jgi:hypothetical protein
MPSETSRLAATAMVAIAFVSNASAADIFRWVDDDGVVHFSDTAPAGDTKVERLRVDSANPPDYDPADDPYSIRNQAERMGETWSRLEERREERRETRREAAERQPVLVYPPYYPYPYRYYAPVINLPGRPGHRPIRPGPTIRRQVSTLDELQLMGSRPHSINSSAHHQRVSSSAGFLDSVRRSAPPRPKPFTP